MSSAIAMMGAMTTQSNNHMIQQGAVTMGQSNISHTQNMFRIGVEGEKSRSNQTLDFANATLSDAMARAKNAAQTLGQASAA